MSGWDWYYALPWWRQREVNNTPIQKIILDGFPCCHALSGDYVVLHRWNHMPADLRGELGFVRRVHPESGVYTVWIERVFREVILNGYEFRLWCPHVTGDR